MRHHDSNAAIFGGEAGDAQRRAVGVVGIVFGGRAAVVDEAQRHHAGGEHLMGVVIAAEFGAAFAVGDGDGEARARHAMQE